MHRPTIHLPPRDRELLKLLASGLTTTELATAMEVTAGAVQSRQRRLTAKLGLRGTADLTVYARANTRRDESKTSSGRQGRLTTVLRTKLHPPVHTPNLVARSRLLEKLDANDRCPLVLVSAPAGYGKSTLVAQWLEAGKTPSAWLSLGSEDSDLRVFLNYFIAAVRTRFPEACSETNALLGVSDLPPPTVLSETLVNDLEAIDQTFHLVLDDYHLIQGTAVHTLVDDLLRYPPRTLRLIIMSRRDPPISVAALRARSCLTEIGQEDLRFSEPETQAVLRREAGATLSDASLKRLDQEIEGWVAGLHLLCLVLRNRKDHDAYLSQLSGGIQHVNEYLLQEVLAQQSEAMQSWLLKASLLDRFCAPLCEAISSRSSGQPIQQVHANEFIRTIQRANLFVIPLDASGEWFRFHHLFQQLLERELRRRHDSEHIGAIHASASDWLETEGFIEEAIQHMLAAGDVDGAAGIVERHRQTEFAKDRWHVVQRWLDMLPSETKKSRPGLLISEAFVAYSRWQLERMPAILPQVEALLEKRPKEPHWAGELAYLRGTVEYWAGEGENSRIHLEEALSLAGDLPHVRAEAVLTLAMARCMCGQNRFAIESLEVRTHELDASEAYLLSRLIAALTFIHLLTGSATKAQVQGQRLQRVANENRIRNTEGWASYLSGMAHLSSFDLEAAARCFTKAADYRYVLETQPLLDSLAGLALAQQFMGQGEASIATSNRLEQIASESGDVHSLSIANSCHARLSLLRNDLPTARERVRLVSEKPEPAGLFFWLEVPALTRARVMMASESSEHWDEAVRLLDEVRHLSEACRFTCQTIEAAVLQSLVLEKQGCSDKALTALGEALALAEPGGWIRPFVEAGPLMDELLDRLPGKQRGGHFAAQIKAACHPRQPVETSARRESAGSDPQSLIEPLTNRELDVLELVVQRLQDKEIAGQLSVSPLTIKTHLKHIYQKLGVSGRRQAANRATSLGLLKHS